MWYIHLFLCSVSKNAFLIKVATLKMWDVYGNLFLFCWKRHELLLDFCKGKSKSILLTTRRNSVDVESWRSTPTAKVKSKQTSLWLDFLLCHPYIKRGDGIKVGTATNLWIQKETRVIVLSMSFRDFFSHFPQ